jgi:DNA-binding NtrC family response regulator
MTSFSPYVLTIDDDPAFGDLIEVHATGWGYGHLHVMGEADLQSRENIGPPAAILLDLGLGNQDGMELLPRLRERWPDSLVFIATTATTVQLAVSAMRLGAYDYLVKPLDIARLEIGLRNAVDHWLTIRRLHELESVNGDGPFADLVGSSESLRQVFRTVRSAAPTNVPILVTGETGTGKELVARAIHRFSHRCEGPFIAVNCAAMPATLVESTLFGSERGAFTGAHEARTGYCQQADGGTLFLDEVTELSVEVQPKLLRFLQDHAVMPVGASTSRTVDVRIIAATNRDPATAIASGQLREDLFYRLNVVTCVLPPLRERRTDIPLLSQYFLRRAAQQFDRQMRSISPAAMHLLTNHDWPGNVRELENLITGTIVRFADAQTLEEHMLNLGVGALTLTKETHVAPLGQSLMSETLEEIEKRVLAQVLQATRGDVSRTAAHLGISPATVYRKVKRYGIHTGS